MKCILTYASLCCLGLTLAQAQKPDYRQFHHWFYQHSQVSSLYASRATLYTFNPETQVMSQPSWKSALLATLPIATAVENIAFKEGIAPTGTRKGYSDRWYKVNVKDAAGKNAIGYIWGGDIARGWRSAELDGNPDTREWVLLGLGTNARTQPTDIRSELRIVRQGAILARQEIKGLCLFEDCDTSPLLRVQAIEGYPHLTMLEASTFFTGCMTGIERAFLFWDGGRLQLAYHAEFSTQTVFSQQELHFQDARSGHTLSCRFSHIDAQFSPVWKWTEHPAAIAAQRP